MNNAVFKKIRVGLLSFLHWAVFLILTVAYFTPAWLKVPWEGTLKQGTLKQSTTVQARLQNTSCLSIGLVSSFCDDVVKQYINDDLHYNLDQVLRVAFILMTVAISAHYVITAMTVAAVTFNLQTHSVYMAFLSVAAAVIYPILATLVIVASIYVETSFPTWVGYSAILSNVAGGLMAVVYIALLTYEYVYSRSRRLSENEDMGTRKVAE